MAQTHSTHGVAAAKLPKERLAQLDRLALSRGITRSWLIRETLERMLEENDVELTYDEQGELARRRRSAEATRRLGEIRRSLKHPLDEQMPATDARRTTRAR